MAKDLAALVVQGIEPREREVEGVAAKVEASRIAIERERLESQLPFDKIAVVWLDHYENGMGRRPSSLPMARLVVNRYLAPKLANKPLPHINRADPRRYPRGKARYSPRFIYLCLTPVWLGSQARRHCRQSLGGHGQAGSTQGTGPRSGRR